MRLHVDVNSTDQGVVLQWLGWRERTDPEWFEGKFSARELLHSALAAQVTAVIEDMVKELVAAGEEGGLPAVIRERLGARRG